MISSSSNNNPMHQELQTIWKKDHTDSLDVSL